MRGIKVDDRYTADLQRGNVRHLVCVSRAVEFVSIGLAGCEGRRSFRLLEGSCLRSTRTGVSQACKALHRLNHSPLEFCVWIAGRACP